MKLDSTTIAGLAFGFSLILILLSLFVSRLIFFTFSLYLLLTGLLAVYVHHKREGG